MLTDLEYTEQIWKVLVRARQEKYLTDEEAGFINNFINRIDKQIKQKIEDIQRLEIETNQLREIKKLLVNMLKDTIAARIRAEQREENILKEE